MVFLVVFVAYPPGLVAVAEPDRLQPHLSNTTAFVGPGETIPGLSSIRSSGRRCGTPLLFTALHVPVSAGLALLLAAMIQALGRFGRTCQTLLFIPVLIPEAMAAVIFIWMLSERFGLVNRVLSAAAGAPLRGELAGGRWGWSMAAIVLTSYWGIGVSVVLFERRPGQHPQGVLRGCGHRRSRSAATLPPRYPALPAPYHHGGF